MFKITCMKCGKETVFTQGNHTLEKDNNNIDWGCTGYGGEVGMWCECENEIDDCISNKPQEPKELTGSEKRIRKMWTPKILEQLERQRGFINGKQWD